MYKNIVKTLSLLLRSNERMELVGLTIQWFSAVDCFNFTKQRGILKTGGGLTLSDGEHNALRG